MLAIPWVTTGGARKRHLFSHSAHILKGGQEVVPGRFREIRPNGYQEVGIYHVRIAQ